MAARSTTGASGKAEGGWAKQDTGQARWSARKAQSSVPQVPRQSRSKASGMLATRGQRVEGREEREQDGAQVLATMPVYLTFLTTVSQSLIRDEVLRLSIRDPVCENPLSAPLHASINGVPACVAFVRRHGEMIHRRRLRRSEGGVCRLPLR
ncbi:uncharacterized protein BDR25DRAFT_318102 [Lindgomyces ingoldianus]|uniref:Uncharacterized protein n=1 Tax=Lindgomyces ingoldianus TaxID=673940 RepID=A0ACB6QIM3_9PLEO|nr:uncharacterized protein BDR25DRAFT_318102 [Lindgomyces ingoldianus]KAF2465967.1 hypothetical protein BDR25DRAFT_318102 [Lindgomyces ingoldianus]